MKWLRHITTLVFDLILLWVLLHYGLGGWQSALLLIIEFAPLSWFVLGLVLFLLLYRSDFRSDAPLFLAGYSLGYWGEWWGTTRGLWTYWNGAMPPEYLPPLWGIGLLTVYRLSTLLTFQNDLPPWARWSLRSSFVVLPFLAFLNSWPLLKSVDWRSRLDGHFFAGLIVAALLITYKFDLRRDVSIYLCGTLLGGMYEYFGTTFSEWTYITKEIPPFWIAPLWGFASVAMVRLAMILRQAVARGLQMVKKRIADSKEVPIFG
jgi:hypothetical protein